MGRRKYEPAAPKPYGFVRVDPLNTEDRRHPAGHHKYKDGTVSGTLLCEIEVLTPVHVASGTLEMQNNRQYPLYKAHVRSAGRPVIPGSSLKGAVRSVVEAISTSCLRITRANPRGLPRNTEGCRDEKRLCAACRMFGSMGYQGQVRFTDAVMREGYRTALARMPSLYAPRNRAGVYFERRQIRGRKFYRHGQPAEGDVPVEVCQPRSILDFSLHFENLTGAELGLMLTALGQGEPPFILKLGGGKPACYGSIRVKLGKLNILNDIAAYYSDYDTDQVASADLKDYILAAGKIIHKKRLHELAELLRIDAGRSCPEGNY